MLSATIVVASLSIFGMLDRLEVPARDAAMRANRAWAMQPVPDDIVVVGIDEAFLETVDEPLALSHRYLARFLSVIADAKPAAVGLDLVLPEKRFDTLAPIATPDTDYHRTLVAGLMQAIQHHPLVVAKGWDADRGHYRDLQTDYVAVLEMQQGGFAAQGSVLLCPDDDGVIRRYPGSDCQPDGSASTFSVELASAAGRPSAAKELIDYRIGGEFQYVPLQHVFQLEAAREPARLAQLFEGKIVLLGAILDETDLVELPVALAEWRPGNRLVPGVLVHAQMLRNLLTGTGIQPLPPALQFVLVAAAGLLVALPRRLRVAGLLFALLLAALAAGTVLLLRQGVALAPVAPALAAGLALLVRWVLATTRARRHRSLIREAFAGHVDDGTLQALISGKSAQPGPVERQVAFLECDLVLGARDGSPPEARARRCAAFLDDVGAAVHRHGGTLDTIGGTRVAAFFGALAPLPSPSKNALEAAADIITAARPGSEGSIAPVHVAIHVADAVATVMQGRGRDHYTVLGDGLRVTSRLLATDPCLPIVCSAEVARLLGSPPFLQPLPGGVYGWNPALSASIDQEAHT